MLDQHVTWDGDTYIAMEIVSKDVEHMTSSHLASRYISYPTKTI